MLDRYIPTDIIDSVKLYNNYNATLSLNNILKGNNKFYILQILEYINTIGQPIYFLFHRYGRIGNTGEIDIDCYIDIKRAIETFEYIFLDKSGIEWADRHNESHYIKGKYIYTELKDNTTEDGELKETIVEPKIHLNINVEEFVNFIYSCNGDFEALTKELDFNSKNKPLGTISKKQIKKATLVLDNINNILVNNATLDDTLNKELINLSSEFYSIIPTYMSAKTVNIINTKEILDLKYNLLNVLLNSNAFIENTLKSDSLYSKYTNLSTDITYVDKLSDEFNVINKYYTINRGATHSHLYGLKIDNIFKVDRLSEKGYVTTPDSYLLWHGTYTINTTGIITNGLQIFQTAKHGSMFGRGLYFANVSTKSMGYLGSGSLDIKTKKKKFVMFLCEVQINNLIYNSIPKTTNNVVQGLGQWTPNIAQHEKLNGCIVPVGDLIQTQHRTLLYDEFVVYDTNKIRLKYILVLTY
jgi:poly [ADP-ribose] polymerase